MKPVSGDATAGVWLTHIPNTDNLALRFFNGGLEGDGVWVLDFYNTRDRCAVNSPEGWEIHISPTVPNSMSLAFSGQVKSWEANSGIASGDIKPGEERFSMPEGVACSLVRPGCEPLGFLSPQREQRLPDNIRWAQPYSALAL